MRPRTYFVVMPALVAGIRALTTSNAAKALMAGTSPATTRK
jgi:hypothetical protein